MISPIRKIEALLARDPELKADAQRAFIAYIKSVYLMKNKDVFDVTALNFETFAASLGLAVTPRIRFLKDKIKSRNDGGQDKSFQNQQRTKQEEESSDSDAPKVGVEAREFTFGDEQEQEDFMTIKRRDHELPDNLPPLPNIEEIVSNKKKKKSVLTKAALAKKMLKKKIVANKKIIFTDDGQMIEQQGKEKFSEEAKAYENEDKAGIDIEKAKQVLRAEDKFDKKLFRERVKQKHKDEKRKLKQARKQQDEEETDDVDVRLGSGSESDDGSEPDTSWIPDPDKFYGKESGSEEEVGSEDDDDEDHEEEEEVYEKPKGKRKKSFELGKVKKKKVDESGFDTGLSLAEDEELALRLLQAKR